MMHKTGGRLNDKFFSWKVLLARAFQDRILFLFLKFLRITELCFSLFINSQAPRAGSTNRQMLHSDMLMVLLQLSVFKGSAFLVILFNFLSQKTAKRRRARDPQLMRNLHMNIWPLWRNISLCVCQETHLRDII